MRFEWDERKNRLNNAKHGISFETACLIFDDPFQLNLQDRHEGGDERWQTLGRAGGIVFLLVAHTIGEVDGEEVVRIISARKATTNERKRYEEPHT